MSSNFWLPTADADNTKAMRDFAIGFSILLTVLFCGLLPWLFEHSVPVWPLYPAAILLALAAVFPKGIYPFYRLWMLVASVLSWINTRLIMLIAFYLMILPLGLVLRALGKLQYQTIDWNKRDRASYWHRRDQAPNKKNLKEPF